MFFPSTPQEAKPHEVAILLVYSMGIRDPLEIAKILHYPTKDSVYKVFRDYKEVLPTLRIYDPRDHFVGRGLVAPTQHYNS